MVPELGQFALALALCLSVAIAFFGLVGSAKGYISWMDATRTATRGQFAFILFAFGCLTYSFVTNDFTLLFLIAFALTLAGRL